MPSGSLVAFRNAVEEIRHLQDADLTPLGAPPILPEVTRVVGRASVVLLSSHLERYIYAINEEATSHLNASGGQGIHIPEALRLLHSQRSIDALIETSWERRTQQLESFVEVEGWLWNDTLTGSLDHERLLRWMRAPTPLNLVRFYRYWGISDIFDAITRVPHTRTELWLKIDELVRKRNNIAHGDLTTEATRADVRSYRDAALRFCDRADRQLARALSRLLPQPATW